MQVLHAAPQISRRIHQLGFQIDQRYNRQPVTLVCVLKGAFMFAADLMRAIYDTPLTVEFVTATSYRGTQSTGDCIIQNMPTDLGGKHVLIVEDILDTGLTVCELQKQIQSQGPASMTLVAFLDKRCCRQRAVAADLVGFTVPDRFVIGYGLDLDQLFRNLRDVCVLEADDPQDGVRDRKGRAMCIR